MTDKVIVVDPAAQAREQLANDMAELKKNPPDETVPGGRYVKQDGSIQDANGKELKPAPKGKE